MTIKDISNINYNLGYLEGLIDGSGLPDDAKSSAFDVIQSIVCTIEKERKAVKDGET